MPKMRPSYEDCQVIINYLMSRASEPGKKPLAIAITDAGGRLISLTLTPGMNTRGALFATKKAYTAAMFLQPTKTIAEHIKSVNTSMVDFCDPNLTPLKGGVPIYHEDGDVIGAVGISGWTSAEDHDLGIEATSLLQEQQKA